jgi:hypothetical protein
MSFTNKMILTRVDLSVDICLQSVWVVVVFLLFLLQFVVLAVETSSTEFGVSGFLGVGGRRKMRLRVADRHTTSSREHHRASLTTKSTADGILKSCWENRKEAISLVSRLFCLME